MVYFLIETLEEWFTGVNIKLNQTALELVVARILPLGDDLDAVADLERFGTIARSFSCHMDSSHSRR